MNHTNNHNINKIMYRSSKFNFRQALLLLLLAVISVTVKAKDPEKDAVSVNGKATLSISENDNLTLKEAKIKCIEEAKIDALKKRFGEMVFSDFIVSESDINDEITSIYINDASSSVKGEWLADEKEPMIDIDYDGKNLTFSAEVWGKAREIVRAKTDVKWHVQKDIGGKKIDTDKFASGERIFLNFKSPSDGFVAVYLIGADDEVACLLPYRKDNSGRYKIKGGKEIEFFDKTTDPEASYYKLNTNMPHEMNQLVMIYSPNPFAKCSDKSVDPKHPNVTDKTAFGKWLLKNQRADKEMMVSRAWVTIQGGE